MLSRTGTSGSPSIYHNTYAAHVPTDYEAGAFFLLLPSFLLQSAQTADDVRVEIQITAGQQPSGPNQVSSSVVLPGISVAILNKSAAGLQFWPSIDLAQYMSLAAEDRLGLQIGWESVGGGALVGDLDFVEMPMLRYRRAGT